MSITATMSKMTKICKSSLSLLIRWTAAIGKNPLNGSILRWKVAFDFEPVVALPQTR
jgi:hypothetical protein